MHFFLLHSTFHVALLSCISFSPQVFEGHPFIVEAGVSIGGRDVKPVISMLFDKKPYVTVVYCL